MNNLFLIGYRGSGKTTIGALVARRSGRPFVDADALLESRAGKSIRDIFAQDGEPAFRVLEQETLAEVCRRESAVIATGGGVVLRPANRQLLHEHGFVAWLAADAATLFARIQADQSTATRRPDLAGGGLSEVMNLLAVREPLYRQTANLTIDVTRLSPEQAADAILAAWTSHISSSSTLPAPS